MLNNWLKFDCSAFCQKIWLNFDWLSGQTVHKWLVTNNKRKKRQFVSSVISDKKLFLFYYFYEPEHKEYNIISVGTQKHISL